MCEAHKPDKWPEVLQRAMEAGGKVCKFQDVSERGACLVQIGSNWLMGVKLPDFRGTNFVLTDERTILWRMRNVPPDTTVIAMPEAKPAEETVDTTSGKLDTGDEFLFRGMHLMKTSGCNESVELEGAFKGRCHYLGKFEKVQKIVRKTAA